MIKPPLVASPRWTPEEDDRLRRLAMEGQSAGVISELLKRKVTAVWARAHKLGISLKAITVRRPKLLATHISRSNRHETCM
jgi:hypothetical protein